jgi:hypothetical protein
LTRVYDKTKEVKKCMGNDVKELNQEESLQKQNTDLKPNIDIEANTDEKLNAKIEISAEMKTNNNIELGKETKPNEDIKPNVNIKPSINIKPSTNVKPTINIKPSAEIKPSESENPNVNVKLDSEESLNTETKPITEEKPNMEMEEKLKKIEHEKLEKIKIQFLNDEEEITRIKKELEEWINKLKSVPEYVKKLQERLGNSIKEFNITYEEKVKESGIDNDEKELKIFNSRKKGINMIEKMMENVTKNYLKLLDINDEEDIRSFKVWNDIKYLNSEELKNMLNENYNLISDLKRKRDGIIKKYFGFISNYILDIIDGIDSGKEISSKQEDLELYKYINDVYDKLYGSFNEELFMKMGISRMKDNVGSTIDL